MPDPVLTRLTAATITAAVLAVVPWYGWQAVRIADDLGTVRDTAPAVERALRSGDLAAATDALARAERAAREAAGRASGTSWRLLGHAPWAGPAAVTVRGLAEAARTLTSTALPLLPQAAPVLGPSGPLLDRRAALPVLADAAPRLADAVRTLDALDARLAALPAGTGVADLDAARALLADRVGKVRTAARQAATAARLLPGLLGADGPRRYFLAFQTNAEARGTGGLVGAFAILTADRGRVSVDTLDSNHGIAHARRNVLSLGREYRELYGDDPLRAMNMSNLSPHFPDAARIWTALWRHQTGRRLDGALALDPAALADLLSVTGPMTLSDGTRLAADTLVDLLERDSYAAYPDPVARKRFLVGIGRAVVSRLATLRPSGGVLDVLGRIAGERRLQVWSARPSEQRILAATPLGGALDARPGPYAGLVVNNAAGNKLDYYLDRSLTYTLGPCRDGRRTSTVEIALRQSAPRGLPRYVAGREDAPGTPHPPGSHHLWVALYHPVGSEIVSTTLDGAPLPLGGGAERGRPVSIADVELRRAVPATLRWTLTEPASAASPRVPVQPMTRPQATRVAAAPCAPVPAAAPAAQPPPLDWRWILALFTATTVFTTATGLLLTRRRRPAP